MRFKNIERFYEQNHQYLLEDNGRRSLRPTKSYTKDILACFEKFKELYLKEGIVEHTKEEFSTFLKVDANTTLQNMRSMQEFGFMNGSFDVSDEDEDEGQSGDNSEDGTYSMTPAFAQLVNSQTNFGSFLFERLSKIRTLDDFTPYLNFLLCTLREAAEYGDIISFGPIAHDKYLKIVTKPEDRQILRSRIFKIYGYCGRRSPGQSENSDNYLPNISYMSFGTLEELGLITSSTPAKAILIPLDNLQYAYTTAKNLRELGIKIEVYPEVIKPQKAFKYANNKGYEWVIITGESEQATHSASLKNMQNGEQQNQLPLEKIADILK